MIWQEDWLHSLEPYTKHARFAVVCCCLTGLSKVPQATCALSGHTQLPSDPHVYKGSSSLLGASLGRVLVFLGSSG